MGEISIPAEITPFPKQGKRAALALQRLGFRILHLGPTISVQGSQSLWASIFKVSFEPQEIGPVSSVEEWKDTYQKALVEQMRIPRKLQKTSKNPNRLFKS